MLLLVVVLQRVEPHAASGGVLSSSTNKAFGHAGLLAVQSLSPSSSAGRGGEGRRRDRVLEAVAWRWWGCVVLALWRGARQSLTGTSGELPRWKTKELCDSTIPFNKRPCRSYLWKQRMEAVMYLLAGRGGEEEMRRCVACGVVKFLPAGRGGEGKRLHNATSAFWRWCCRFWICCRCTIFSSSSSSRAGALRRELGLIEHRRLGPVRS